jgi:hypothetical protein
VVCLQCLCPCGATAIWLAVLKVAYSSVGTRVAQPPLSLLRDFGFSEFFDEPNAFVCAQ